MCGNGTIPAPSGQRSCSPSGRCRESPRCTIPRYGVHCVRRCDRRLIRPEIIRVERQVGAGDGQSCSINDTALAQIGQERPLRGALTVHRFDRQAHAELPPRAAAVPSGHWSTDGGRGCACVRPAGRCRPPGNSTLQLRGEPDRVMRVFHALPCDRPSLPVNPPAHSRLETVKPHSASSSIPFSSP